MGWWCSDDGRVGGHDPEREQLPGGAQLPAQGGVVSNGIAVGGASMSKDLDERIVEVPGALIDAGAQAGVVLVDMSARALGSVLGAIGDELKRQLGALMDALSIVQAGIRAGCDIDTWRDELGRLADDYDAANLEELAAVLEAKIAELQDMDRAVDAFGAEVDDGE
jgi:hypothetical protein